MRRRAFFNWRYVAVERRRPYKLWAAALLLSIPALFLIERSVVSTGKVTDISMLPTLDPGSYFLINKYVYRFSAPRRGDVVVLRPLNHPRWLYVKRVVALGGETISVAKGQVWVNSRLLEEPYVSGSTQPGMDPLRVPEGSYFLMGDNRPNSEDSRSFGPVPKERIVGKIKPKRLFCFR